jgi:anti-sigma regulatory factor (Ser/Thr protein kinase)
MPSLNASAALDAVYPAQPARVAEIRRDVTTAATGCGADELALLRINLAVSEAASNAILHAYRDGAPRGDVHVLVWHADDCLDVSVCDNGIGMSPRTDSPGMGLGLGLIAHETTTCEIRTTASGGTEVLMRFDLGPLAS